MKKVALLHTVKSVYNTFPERIIKQIPNVEVTNTVDEFLASDANINGFTKNNLNRLFNILKSMDRVQADAMVVTCSTLTPGVEQIRPFLNTPVLAIDDAMAVEAVQNAEKIMVLATAQSTIQPTCSKLQLEASKLNKKITIYHKVYDEAYTAIKNMDAPTHDRILLDAAKEIQDADMVVLAQASMAHLEKKIEKICGCKVVSSPQRCINLLEKILAQTEAK